MTLSFQLRLLPQASDFYFPLLTFWGFPEGSDGKASACNAGNWGLIPESGRYPEEGNGNPLQTLAWKIPWIEEPGGLQSMGLQRLSDFTFLKTFNLFT